MQLGFTFSALIMVIYLVMDVIELVIVGFDDWMLIGYEILEEKFKFQKLKLTCLASDLFNSSMLEA